MGIPEPLTQAIIIEIQVPINKMLPNTNGCSGSLEIKIKRMSSDYGHPHVMFISELSG